MPLDAATLADRVAGALLGAAAGEALAGAPAGVRQLLELSESLAGAGGVDGADLSRRGLESQPAPGPAGLLLRAIPIALLTPLDRPRVRRDAHRCARLGGADEGTAMTAVAAAVLAADCCRFDLETALVRVRQTLLEEAPMALLNRLAPLGDGAMSPATSDPGHTLQLAITAVHGAWSLPQAVEAAALNSGDVAAVAALTGALAGVVFGLSGVDPEWLESIPARQRALAAAQALAESARSLLPAGG
jgi:ADP-ribosylglycohydrolase